MAIIPQVSMQNLVHPARILGSAVVIAALTGVFSAETNAIADSIANPTGPGKIAELRLIGAVSAADGQHRAGAEIALAAGALTYWRQPGDAGVPPVFSFTGSDNLLDAEVLYPAPTRIKEDEGEAFGYQGKVIFPIHATPRDKTKPIVLKLTVDYAVCERICIPAKSHAEISLPSPPGRTDDPAIAAAEARVPQRLSAEEAASKIAASPEPGAKSPTWRIAWKGPTPATDLFAESPDGWFFVTKKSAAPNEFQLVAVETPSKPAETVSIRLTVTGARQNFELVVALDAIAADR